MATKCPHCGSVLRENTGLRAALNWKCAEIERLRDPFRAVDAQDWEFVMGALPDGGRGRFWKAVLTEMRAALEEKAAEHE